MIRRNLKQFVTVALTARLAFLIGKSKRPSAPVEATKPEEKMAVSLNQTEVDLLMQGHAYWLANIPVDVRDQQVAFIRDYCRSHNLRPADFLATCVFLYTTLLGAVGDNTFSLFLINICMAAAFEEALHGSIDVENLPSVQ